MHLMQELLFILEVEGYIITVSGHHNMPQLSQMTYLSWVLRDAGSRWVKMFLVINNTTKLASSIHPVNSSIYAPAYTTCCIMYQHCATMQLWPCLSDVNNITAYPESIITVISETF